mmetsp:Transcript_90006/g.234583  ORF Transcript_90006/g.234583 Transcript_90006/m.234583 type:complete len:231 (+) Transcript_90006:62-754(+)|eukprot:CAMPEP_0183547820 /NCGR_PEP_ID=MMETSP0371-20130417/57616_1 /TAXON_ID=268820 /ORGANISM="Peridinium aciculiferum, Strain PAER-2" /LENGTH=230 /DNA_ID=CAMNT_0025750907 /DNA_START=59 /DNA_END=751 /DNA_ORIENTATION=-
MAKFASLLIATCVAGAAAAGKPLITTDLIYSTGELLQEGVNFAWAKADVDGLLAKAQGPIEQAKKEASKQMAMLFPQLEPKIAEAQIAALQIKATAMGHAEQGYEAANKKAVAAIEALEKVAPSLVGVVPKTLGNFVLFGVYMLLVAYVLLKVLRLGLKIVFGILGFFFCGLLCCGLCCRGGKKAAPTNGKAKAKAKSNGATNSAAATAASKGKAAATTAAPSAPTLNKK